MMDVLDSYSRGIEYLLRRLGKDHAEYLNAETLTGRLRENIDAERCYGATDTTRADRARILAELTRLSLKTLNKAFSEISETPSDSNLRYANRPLPLRIPSKSLDYFVGRVGELRSIKRLLQRQTPQPIALCGMGGVGKSTLARKIADDLDSYFSGGVFWADFAAHQGDSLPILYSWAYVLGHPEVERIPSAQIRAQAVMQLICEYTERVGRVLVVFDDVRQTETDAWLDAADLLRSAVPKGTPLLITTRQLEVAQSLRAKPVELDTLQTDQAIDLLAQLLQDEDLPLGKTVILMETIGSLPLAVEVVAGMIQADGLDWVYKTVTNQYSRLDALHAGDLRSKADNVQLSFTVSYEGLPAEAQALFRLTGVLASNRVHEIWLGGILHHLSSSGKLLEHLRISDLLRMLHHRGFLQRVDSNYRLHPLLRDYARSLLAEDPSLQDVGIAHERYFLDLVTAEAQRFEVVSEAIENILRAAQYAHDGRLWDDLLQFTLNLAVFKRYLYTRGLWNEALRLLDRGIEACVMVGDVKNQAALYCEKGTLQREMGTYDAAIVSFETATQLSQKINDEFILASALFGHGYVLLYSSNYREAKDRLSRAVSLAHKANNPNALGEALRGLGRIELSINNLDQALQYLMRSIEVLSSTDNKQGLAYAYRALGEIHTLQGQVSVGLGNFQTGLAIAQNLGDPQAQAYILRGIGDAYKTQGELILAMESYTRSEELYRNTDDRAARAGTLCSIGEVCVQLGDLDRAMQMFDQSRSLPRDINLPRWEARSLFGQAQVAHAKGDIELAGRLGRQALDQLHKVGHRDANMVEKWLGTLSVNGKDAHNESRASCL